MRVAHPAGFSRQACEPLIHRFASSEFLFFFILPDSCSQCRSSVFRMHFVLIMMLIGGGAWWWSHTDSPGNKLLAGVAIGLGIIASLGLAAFYRALHRDQKK